MISRFIKKVAGKASTEDSTSQRNIPETPPAQSHRHHHDHHRYPYDRHHWDSGYSREYSSYDSSGYRRRDPFDYDSDLSPRGYPPPYARHEGFHSSSFSPPRGFREYRDDFSSREYRRRDVQTQPSSYQMSAAPAPVQTVTPRAPPMQPMTSHPSSSKPKLERKYSKIVDEYRSLDEVLRIHVSIELQRKLFSVFVQTRSSWSLLDMMSKNVGCFIWVILLDLYSERLEST